MQIKRPSFVFLFLLLVIININFAQYLECGRTISEAVAGRTVTREAYPQGTITRSMCDTVQTFRSFLGPAIMLLILGAAALYALGQAFGAETRARAVIWAENLIIAAFISVIIYSLFTERTIIDLLTGQFPGAYFKHIVIALSFGVMWVALFYLPGYVLQNPQLQLAAREELGVFIMSLIILMSWGILTQFLSDLTVGIISSTAPGLAVPAQPQALTYLSSHLDIAYGALEIFFVKLRTQYVHLYLFEVLIGFLSTVSFPIGSPLPAVGILSFSFMPYDGLVLLSNAHTIVVESIGYLMSTIWAKEFIIIFARDVIPTILLPLGLILRAFPWFRSTGSSLIAICIVIYFVYPLTVVFSNYLVFDVFEPAIFLFTPDDELISIYSGSSAPDAEELRARADELRREARRFTDEFRQDRDIVRASVEQGCVARWSNPILPDWVVGALCSVGKIISFGWNAVSSFVHTAFDIWVNMMRFTGDWFSGFGVFPSGSAAGLYAFVIEEVINISQLIIIITVTSVIEIIITITMYRNIAELIGGELEIAGLTKLV